jgi:hypothetical protein
MLAGLLLATGLSPAQVLLSLLPVLGLSGLAAVFLVAKPPAED